MTRKTACDSRFAIGGVSCSADSFVVVGSSVLRINICGERLALRQYPTVMCYFVRHRKHQKQQ